MLINSQVCDAGVWLLRQAARYLDWVVPGAAGGHGKGKTELPSLHQLSSLLAVSDGSGMGKPAGAHRHAAAPWRP